MLRFLLCLSYIIFLFAFPVTANINSDSDKGIIRIELHRQKTPFEQHLNAPNLEQFGVKYDWLFKKHFNRGAPAPRTNDSIALKRYFDNEFYGSIVMGHPGQTLFVAFDTAWTLSWVISSECEVWRHMGCLFHNKYDHSKSSEYKPNNEPIVVPEGKYNLTGFLSYDNISIAHSNVTNFTFAEMTDVPYSFLFSKVDGVLGLGLKYDSYEPFFYNLVRNKKIVNPVFCIYLNRDKQSNKGGNIILGFIEKRHIHSHKDANNNTIYDKINYLPVKSGQYWQFNLDRVWVDTQKESPLSFCDDGKCSAITDTSSNNILGPQSDIDKIHTVIKARPFFLDRYTVDCDTINKLPEMGFTLGGQNFTLKGRDYTVKMTYLSVSICLSAFVPHDYQDFWVLGGAFLSEYYTIYNVQEKQIGFVKSA